MAPGGPLDAAGLMIEVLDELGIPYMVVGSVASSVHGIPRSTMAVDIVADVQASHVAPLVSALESEYYADAEMIRDALLHRSCFNVIHLSTMCKVDIFVPAADGVSGTEMTRRRRYLIVQGSEVQWYVASAEDTILRKLQWFRAGGEVSERQRLDILGIFQVLAERLDLPYLHDGARLLGVSDLLEEALQEAEIEC